MIRMSAVVFFSDKSSREDSLNMSYEESHSIIIIIIKVFIESKDKNTYLMLQAIKIKNDLQY